MSEVGTPRIEAEPKAAAVDLSGVARRFGRRWALRGVSLRVAAGEAVALAGANGSGKTTLLRIVATSLRPTRGSGSVFGHDLLGEAAGVREVVGVLGHQPGIYDDLSAAENVRFAMSMSGARPSDDGVYRALEAAGLGQVACERARGFSSGMRRRLALARLLMRPPRLLLLDEPYASFDAEGIDLVNSLVSDVVAAGGAALVASHDVERGAEVLGRVVRLESGLIAEDRALLGAVSGATSAPREDGLGARVAAGAQVRVGGRS